MSNDNSSIKTHSCTNAVLRMHNWHTLAVATGNALQRASLSAEKCLAAGQGASLADNLGTTDLDSI